MKARWLKSVVEHSKDAGVTLPFHRDRRKACRPAQGFDRLRRLKTA